MSQSTSTTPTDTQPRRKRGRPPIPEDQRKAGFHLQVRPEVKADMLALSAEIGVPVAQLVEAVWFVAAGFARAPDGARLLQDHAAAMGFGKYVARKVSARETVVLEGVSDFDGVESGMLDVARHIAAAEGRG